MEKLSWKTENRKLGELIEFKDNPRQISKKQYEDLSKSLKKFGLVEIPVIDLDNTIIAGHQRIKVLSILKKPDNIIEVRVPNRKLTDKEFKEYNIRSNKNTGSWDFDILANCFEIGDLCEWGFNMGELTGFESQYERHPLAKEFIVPPFSVLDTKQGYWQERKKKWSILICDKAETRESLLSKKNSHNIMNIVNDGTSILDPVLSEVIVRWFGIKGGKTFDCFAGDSVFGYVSTYMGHSFTGIELRKEQCDLNNKRISEIKNNAKSKYICDDGRNVLKHIKPVSQDLFFSCPPYFDLEVYSDLENDASNQKSYNDFIGLIDTALTNSMKCLKKNRFAAIVVSDIRDKKGAYRGFPDDIKQIMKKSGLVIYNELILVNTCGTLPRRVRGSMKTRKVGRMHQNVLIFYKGDIDKIKENYEVLKPNKDYGCEDLES